MQWNFQIMDTLEMSVLSIVQFFRGRNAWTNRQGVNSVSIVGRLPTLQSVHYQRFHCIIYTHVLFIVSKLNLETMM